jgi:heptosyltransferase-2
MVNFSNILIIKPGAIGDLLHMTPVFRALKKKLPDVRISVLVGNAVSAELFRHNPLVDKVIIFDRKGVHRSWSALLGLWHSIREDRFDLVLNFQRSNLKAWFLVTAAMPCRVLVYHKERRRTVHAIVNHLEVLKPLGILPENERLALDFYPAAADEQFAADIFNKNFAGETVVAFNPGTNHLCKCWPVEYFSLLGDRLADELGARVLILGSRAEKELADQIIAGMRNVPLDLTGCSLGELAAILEKSALLVTGDTGPMHIASAVGTRVVALYGPISPERSGPLGEGHRILMHSELHCCPCNSFSCKNKNFRECMKLISVEEVFSAIKEMFEEDRGRRFEARTY